jgi:4-hydroxybenzoate polyprenyltransferase
MLPRSIVLRASGLYSLAAVLAGIVRTMRPHQWVKNLFVVAPLVFAKELFDPSVALRSVAAFFLFSFASSTVYILNDLADVEADRQHPIKRNRPIASGAVSPVAARNAGIVLAAVVVAGGALLSLPFLATLLAYLVMNLAYSARLKRVPYVDVLCIATGFELRVLAGSFAALVEPSAYLLVVTFLLASFLGFGKRTHELNTAEEGQVQRKVLRAYSGPVLTALLYLTSLATVATYVVYTLDEQTRAAFGTPHLWVTSPFTLFGVMRFLHLVRNRPDAESPTEEMLRDRPFIANLAVWALAVVVVIYVGGDG